MENLTVALLASSISTIVLFLAGFYYGVSGNKKWIIFMILALLNSAVSCLIILYFVSDKMPTGQVRNLKIAGLALLVLAALFYGAYRIAKNNNDEKKA